MYVLKTPVLLPLLDVTRVKSVNVHRNTFIILFKAKKKIVSGQEFIMAGFAKSTLYCSLILRCYAKNNHLL